MFELECLCSVLVCLAPEQKHNVTNEISWFMTNEHETRYPMKYSINKLWWGRAGLAHAQYQYNFTDCPLMKLDETSIFKDSFYAILSFCIRHQAVNDFYVRC